MTRVEKIADELLEKEVALQKIENTLQKRSEAFKALIEERAILNNSIQELKDKLKEVAAPEGEKVVRELGNDTLSVNVWNTLSIKSVNLEEMDEQYVTEKEILNIVERDGRYYQRTGNTTLVKNLVENGLKCPAGFEEKRGRAISIKYNGKAL